MPVLVERLDISRMSQGRDIAITYSALINEDSEEAAVLYELPTGSGPILSVKFDEKNKKEARIYVAKENKYLPVWNTPEKIQIVASDESEDDFPQQRIATLTPSSPVYSVPIKRNGEKTGAWAVFRLIETDRV